MYECVCMSLAIHGPCSCLCNTSPAQNEDTCRIKNCSEMVYSEADQGREVWLHLAEEVHGVQACMQKDGSVRSVKR